MCSSIKGSEVWCLFRATLPCILSIGCVDRTPFGGAWIVQPGMLKISAVASVAWWPCMVGLRGTVFFGQWSVVGACSHSSSLIVFTHLYCRISIVCGIIFFQSMSILTLIPPMIHTYYTTYFSTEIYQSESGWQKESRKSSLCTPRLATVSNLILFCVLIWLKKWPLGKFGAFNTRVLANYEDNIITSPN